MTYFVLVKSADVRSGPCLIADCPLLKKPYSQVASNQGRHLCVPGLTGYSVEVFTGNEHVSLFIPSSNPQ